MFNGTPYYSVARLADGRTFSYALHGDTAHVVADALSRTHPGVTYGIYRHDGRVPSPEVCRYTNGTQHHV